MAQMLKRATELITGDEKKWLDNIRRDLADHSRTIARVNGWLNLLELKEAEEKVDEVRQILFDLT